MKKPFYTLIILFITSAIHAQSVGIGTNTPDASALLHLQSNTKGFLVPVMATSERLAIPTPAYGLQVYDYEKKSIWMYSTGGWVEMVTTSTNFWLENGFDIYRSTGNVGIGIMTPVEKLQVHNSLANTNSLRITNATTGSTITDGLSLESNNLNAGLMNYENGLLSIGTNNNNVLHITANGKVGIDVTNPVAKFQIAGRGISSPLSPAILIVDSLANSGGALRFRQAGNTTGIFLSEYSGNSFNHEQYLDVRSDSQYIATFRGNGYVGIRNTAPLYPLDVSGDFNTSGRIRINGNPGIAGQVLTSNGTAAPVWKNTSYENDIRFSFNFTQINATANSDSLNFNWATPNYNLNPSMVAAVAGNVSRIRINKTGLYHFSGSISATHLNIAATSNPPWAAISYSLDNNDFGIESSPTHAVAALPDDDFTKTFQFSINIYITAGQTIKFKRSVITYAGGSHSTSGYVNGYLVSE